MPPHMAFSGQNFDILTGIFALLVAGIWQLGVRSQAMVWIWNILGFILLLNVIGLALLSMPTPLQQIFSDPPNIWITFFPFTYLPTVLVAFALFGHLLIFRRLWAERQGNKAGAV